MTHPSPPVVDDGLLPTDAMIEAGEEAVADWLDYSLNRCGLVVVEEQSLARMVTDNEVERVARAICAAMSERDGYGYHLRDDLTTVGLNAMGEVEVINLEPLARAALAASDRDVLVAENARLRDHISEQATHVETRIQDGRELGVTVWRLALEDVARENRAALIPLAGEPK